MIIFMQLEKQQINYERIFETMQRRKKYFKYTNTQNLEVLQNYHLFHITVK